MTDAILIPKPVRGTAQARLDGWKSIAAYFGRDRTTVIRWARERGLPVHRLPGGKTATVYALRDELDIWAGLARFDESQEVATPAIPAGALKPRRGLRPWISGAAAILVLGLASTLAIGAATQDARSASASSTPALPHDPVVARDFLAARDLTANREALGLEEAIILLEKVVDAEPAYAPAQASLAEALLLSREFGMRSDASVFPRARTAARMAMRLDPDLASGHRMLGFIAYWADNDIDEARGSFRQALELDPDDALSHFWYGNILSDHGDHVEGLKALDRARLLLPGSVAIGTDLAWAQWSAGDDTAVARLRVIAQSHPDFVVVQDCLAIIALAEGDLGGYVRHFNRFAMLRRDKALQRRAAALNAARDHGRPALRAEIMNQALAEIMSDGGKTHILPAVIASTARDRESLRTMLRRADGRRERWGQAGLTERLARTWRSDRELSHLIARRQLVR